MIVRTPLMIPAPKTRFASKKITIRATKMNLVDNIQRPPGIRSQEVPRLIEYLE